MRGLSALAVLALPASALPASDAPATAPHTLGFVNAFPSFARNHLCLYVTSVSLEDVTVGGGNWGSHGGDGVEGPHGCSTELPVTPTPPLGIGLGNVKRFFIKMCAPLRSLQRHSRWTRHRDKPRVRRWMAGWRRGGTLSHKTGGSTAICRNRDGSDRITRSKTSQWEKKQHTISLLFEL